MYENIGRRFGKDNILSEFCKSYIGKKNHAWKGDKVKYRALHMWVEQWRGKPNKCEQCKSEVAKRYDWANKSGEYIRNLNDWIRLCRSCHVKRDKCWLKRSEISRNKKGQFTKV